jgi:hypothetical protein
MKSHYDSLASKSFFKNSSEGQRKVPDTYGYFAAVTCLFTGLYGQFTALQYILVYDM